MLERIDLKEILKTLIKSISTTISNKSSYPIMIRTKVKNTRIGISFYPIRAGSTKKLFRPVENERLWRGKHLCRHVLDVARVSLIALVLSNQTVACHVCKVTYASGFKVATARHSSMLFSHTLANDSFSSRNTVESCLAFLIVFAFKNWSLSPHHFSAKH